MAVQIQILKKSGIIEGQTVNWQVLGLSNTLNGIPLTLELPLKGKATQQLAKAILESDETLSVEVRPTTDEEKEKFLKSVVNEPDESDFLNE